MTSSPSWITASPSRPREGSSNGAFIRLPRARPAKAGSHLGNFQTANLGSITPAMTPRCLIPWECFGDLLGDPLGGWICCHIGPDEPSPLQTQDDQPVEQLEPDRRNDEQIDAGDVGGVIAQESLPARRAR